MPQALRVLSSFSFSFSRLFPCCFSLALGFFPPAFRPFSARRLTSPPHGPKQRAPRLRVLGSLSIPTPPLWAYTLGSVAGPFCSSLFLGASILIDSLVFWFLYECIGTLCEESVTHFHPSTTLLQLPSCLRGPASCSYVPTRHICTSIVSRVAAAMDLLQWSVL